MVDHEQCFAEGFGFETDAIAIDSLKPVSVCMAFGLSFFYKFVTMYYYYCVHVA